MSATDENYDKDRSAGGVSSWLRFSEWLRTKDMSEGCYVAVSDTQYLWVPLPQCEEPRINLDDPVALEEFEKWRLPEVCEEKREV